MHMHITKAGKGDNIIRTAGKSGRAEKGAVDLGQEFIHADLLKYIRLYAHIHAPFRVRATPHS